MTPAIIRTETLHQGWGRYVRVTVRLEDGVEVRRDLEDHGHAAAILPYDPERRTLLLARQLRMGPLLAGDDDPYLLEAPAGMVETETAAETARREAMEEIGVHLDAVEALGEPYSTAGVSTERIALFLARYRSADRVAEGGGVEGEHERITVVELPAAEVWARFTRGELRDLKTIALLAVLKDRQPALFAPSDPSAG